MPKAHGVATMNEVTHQHLYKGGPWLCKEHYRKFYGVDPGGYTRTTRTEKCAHCPGAQKRLTALW